MAKFFAGAIDWLENNRQFRLLYLHAGALRHVWDAPLDLRESYADEDDPPAAEIVVPPVRQVTDESDPDEMLALRHTYAGQISMLDNCLNWFLDAIDATFQEDSLLLAVLGPRGYPLGEHSDVGLMGAHLFGELTHGACFLRAPTAEARDLAGLHSPALAQPRDVHATLCEWLNLVDLTDELRHTRCQAQRPKLLVVVRSFRLFRSFRCSKVATIGLACFPWRARTTAKSRWPHRPGISG